MITDGNISCQKNADKFFCKTCLYSCRKESNYKAHLLTRKHQNGNKMVTNGNNGTKNAALLNMESKTPKKNAAYCKPVTPKNAEKMPQHLPFICESCGNRYKHRSGLSRHRKKCYIDVVDTIDQITNIPHDNQGDFKELILLLLKDNKEIQKNFMDMLPHLKGNAENSYNNTNSHNTNNFNIQMFLNEHCKNAMNLTDFIDTLPLTAETYNNTLENGLTKSITTMITNGLNNIDILERPIHCTDPARKTMYIKDNDVWEKDTELNVLLENIALLATKHRININKWQDANTGWEKNENLQTKMTTLVFNSMTSIEDDEKEVNKIVRAIGKNTYLSTDIKNEFK